MSVEQSGVQLSVGAGVATKTHVLLLVDKSLLSEAYSRAKVEAMLRRGWSLGVVTESGELRYCATMRDVENLDWAAAPKREAMTAALTSLAGLAGRRLVVAQKTAAEEAVLLPFSYRVPEVYEIVSEKAPALAKGDWQSLRDRPVAVGTGDQSPLIGPDFRPIPDTLTKTNHPVTEQQPFVVTTPAGIWWRGSSQGALDAAFANTKSYYDFTVLGHTLDHEAMTVSVRSLEPGMFVSAAVYTTRPGAEDRVLSPVVPKVDVMERRTAAGR